MPTYTIPPGITFADLQMARDPDGELSVNAWVLECICRANGLPEDFFARDEMAFSEMMVNWYCAHLATGGMPDPVQQDILAEVFLEEERGQSFSYPPGIA